MSRSTSRALQPFGERYAWSSLLSFTGMAVYLYFGSIVNGRPTGFYITLLCLPLFHGYRVRAANGERRRGETLEDERDAGFWAFADRVFRISASCWYGLLALGLSFDGVRAALPVNAYAIPGLLLLGILIANIAAHAGVAWRYRRDRQ